MPTLLPCEITSSFVELLHREDDHLRPVAVSNFQWTHDFVWPGGTNLSIKMDPLHNISSDFVFKLEKKMTYITSRSKFKLSGL